MANRSRPDVSRSSRCTTLGRTGNIAANRDKVALAEATERARQLAGPLQEGFLECGEGDATYARNSFEQARRLNPESAEARAGYALALVFEDDFAGALAFLSGPESRAGRAAWAGRW